MKKNCSLVAIVLILLMSCKRECSCGTASSGTLNDGLVAYYPFNGNTLDESGNNNNGIASGGSLSSDKNGNTAKAYNFDGNSYIKVANSSSLSGITNTFSLAAWVYNEQPEVYIVCKSDYNGSELQYRVYADNSMIHVADNGTGADLPGTLSNNSWKHLSVTCDGTTARYYLNGILVKTETMHSAANSNNHTTDMYIGADTHGTTEFFQGKLDEIRIYNRVLNATEIQQLYNL